VTSPTEESTGKHADTTAKSRRRARNEWIILLVLTVAGTFLIRTYVMQSYRIPSGSMEHTLHGCTPNCNNDRILVDKLSYHLHGVGRGDIVVFKTTDQRWIQAVGGTEDVVKRVIGLPGDTVMCCDAQGRVVVNGKALNEKYVFVDGPDPKKEFGPVTVPKGDLWVMGDHRNDSSDSRYNGPITISSVIGRAFMRIWPINRIGGL
jgi:signal peptidase I